MINLLPPEAKQNILYARRNTALLRWLLAMSLGLIGLLVIIAAGQIYLSRAAQSYAAEVEATEQQLKVQKLDETERRISELSASLQLMVQVLSRQVLFSDLIRQIGAAIPTGAALTDLSISQLKGGTDLQFKSTDYQTATQIQVNLEDPSNRIFEQADIVSINCVTPLAGSTTADSRYPCNVSLRALFAKDNPFLFISKSRAVANP